MSSSSSCNMSKSHLDSSAVLLCMIPYARLSSSLIWSSRMHGTSVIPRCFAAMSRPCPSTITLWSLQIPIGSENPKRSIECIICSTSSSVCFLVLLVYSSKAMTGRYSIFKCSMMPPPKKYISIFFIFLSIKHYTINTLFCQSLIDKINNMVYNSICK